MRGFTTGHTARPFSQRPFARATAALAAAGLAAAGLAAGLAAGIATAASAQPAPSPALKVAPGAVTTAPGSRYVFYTASDGSVWQKAVGGGTATPVGGVLISAPSPVYDGSHVVVFGEGTDHALWDATCAPGGSCGPWTTLGGVLTSGPGAVFTGPNGYDESVYVRGSDGALWARGNTATGWAPWHLVGGNLLSGTGPSADWNGTEWVLVTGTDQQMYLLKVGAVGFNLVGGRTTATPALTHTSSSLIGFATGTDDTGFYTTMDGTWNSLGGVLTSGFGATSDQATPYGYALGGNGQVYQDYPGGTWYQVTP